MRFHLTFGTKSDCFNTHRNLFSWMPKHVCGVIIIIDFFEFSAYTSEWNNWNLDMHILNLMHVQTVRLNHFCTLTQLHTFLTLALLQSPWLDTWREYGAWT